MNELNMEEKIFHGKVKGQIIHRYKDRKVIQHFEENLQNRVNGAVGMEIEEIWATVKGFKLICTDKNCKNGKRKMLIVLTGSKLKYGDTMFRLTAREEIRKDVKKETPEDVKKKVDEIRRMHQAESRAQ